jgi:hypothetical protein
MKQALNAAVNMGFLRGLPDDGLMDVPDASTDVPSMYRCARTVVGTPTSDRIHGPSRPFTGTRYGLAQSTWCKYQRW